jgi:LmbE family N-acetylglucosaminyl deacetylase
MTALSVLFVGAHPDDESMLAGATLALLHHKGHRTHVLCATRGEGGELGEPPVTDDRNKLAEVREKELRCACEALGTGLTLLDYIDPLIGEGDTLYPFTANFETLAGQIADVIEAQQADVVLTHGSDGEYGHPAHRLVHRATRHAVENTGREIVLYSVAALIPDIEDRLWNKSDPAHLAFNIDPFVEEKHQAALCHRSQHALFKRRRKLDNVRQALRMTESFHRHLPPLENHQPPDDAFARMMLEAGAWRPEHPDKAEQT